MRLDLGLPAVALALEAWGVPYVYGAGEPRDVVHWPLGVVSVRDPVPSPGRVAGWDCSGYAQVHLVKRGLLSPSAKDRRAASFPDFCDPVNPGDERPDDLVLFGLSRETVSHVMVYMGNGVVFGATGGTSKTFGRTPAAYCDFRRWGYRPDFFGSFRARR